MKEEQLNEMAQSCACSIRNEFDEDFPELSFFELENECRFAFKQGARWHESLPLAERLSESEAHALRELHLKYQQMRDEYKDKGEWGDARSCDEAIVVLEFLFGKDLFTKSE